MGYSTYLDNALLDKIFRNVDFTVNSAYISLHTGDPGDTGADEITVGTSGYARQIGTMSAAASSGNSNSAVALFTNLPAGTIGYAGVWDAPTGTASNFLMGAALATSRIVVDGDSFQFNIDSIVGTHT